MERETPEVTILLLGDAEVGKSTFLSRLTLGRNPRSANQPLPTLRDLDQPFVFDITLYNRPYRFEIYDTASPTNYTLLRPDFLILCFDIGNRATFNSLPEYWRKLVEMHYNYDEALPVMLLGLKRDLRREWTEEEEEQRTGSVMPQEGVRVAAEMRCDRYAECSAVTGELCKEVLEDVARTAALTTTEKGAKTAWECVAM